MKIIKIKNDKESVKSVLAVLKKGGLIIYPTETCYGLGADATNPKAVEKVMRFKGGSRGCSGGKPVSVAVTDRKMAEKYVVINKTAANLYQEFLPGPLTVVSKSKGRTSKLLEAGQGTLGIRIPDHGLAIKMIKEFKGPITSTSANASGKKTPYCLQDVLKYTSKKKLGLVDLFLDAGRLPFHLPSTVVDTTMNELKALRQGEIKILATKSNSFISDSEAETKKIAAKVLEKNFKNLDKKTLIFALQGELGSGKTQFAKGLGLALGIKQNIASPTFTIIREYSFFKPNLQRPVLCKFGVFYHLDTWRLERGEELLELGLEKMLKPGNVIAIEWLQKIKSVLEKIQRAKRVKIVWVNIDHLSQTKRKISYGNI